MERVDFPVTESIYGPLGGDLVLPAGDTHVASAVRIRDSAGLAIRGQGPTTGIVYDGPVGGSCLEFTGTIRATVERLWLRARLDHVTRQPVAEAGVVLTKRPGDVYAQTKAMFRDVWWGSQNGLADFRYAVLIDSLRHGEPDGNNDLPKFTDCRFRGYSDAAVWVVAGSTQVHKAKFVDCEMEGLGRARYGVRWDAKPDFTWEGGSGGDHTAADFWIGDVGDTATIRGWNSEWSECLVDTGGPTGAVGPVVIDDCRAAAVRCRDGAVIRGRRPGPWVVANNRLSTANRGVELFIDLTSNFAPVVATVTNNVVVHGREPKGPFVRAPKGSRLTVGGNVHVYPGGSFID